MNISTLYEITSNDKLLTSLGLAVAEARMVRSLVRSRKPCELPDPKAGRHEWLTHLDREIDYLEEKMVEVKSRADDEKA